MVLLLEFLGAWYCSFIHFADVDFNMHEISIMFYFTINSTNKFKAGFEIQLQN